MLLAMGASHGTVPPALTALEGNVGTQVDADRDKTDSSCGVLSNNLSFSPGVSEDVIVYSSPHLGLGLFP